MADKLPQTVVVLPTFVDGEIPPAAKLTVLAAQTRAANRKLEKAVGDHLDQGRPYSAALGAEGLSAPIGGNRYWPVAQEGPDTLPLDIVSLSRLIGPASLLNIRTLPGDGTTREVEESISGYSGHIYQLGYPIGALTTPVIVETTAGVYTNEVASLGLLAAHGDYYVDYEKNEIVSYSLRGDHDGDGNWEAGWSATITYEYSPNKMVPPGGTRLSTWNVIPGPQQLSEGGTGLTAVSGADPGYQRFLLPTIENSIVDPESAMSYTELSASSPDYLLQLEVPYVLQEHLVAGDQIPEGFMVLKNYTTGHAYTEAEILYVDASHIDVGNVDLSAEIAAGDALYLVTVGNSITESINSMWRAMSYPGDPRWGWGRISVNALKDLLDPRYYPTAYNAWMNPAPQYLHRDGYVDGQDENNGSNAMRGDLYLGAAGAATLQGVVAEDGAASVKLRFAGSGGAYIYQSFEEGLQVVTKPLADGGTGIAFYDENYNAGMSPPSGTFFDTNCYFWYRPQEASDTVAEGGTNLPLHANSLVWPDVRRPSEYSDDYGGVGNGSGASGWFNYLRIGYRSEPLKVHISADPMYVPHSYMNDATGSYVSIRPFMVFDGDAVQLYNPSTTASETIYLRAPIVLEGDVESDIGAVDKPYYTLKEVDYADGQGPGTGVVVHLMERDRQSENPTSLWNSALSPTGLNITMEADKFYYIEQRVTSVTSGGGTRTLARPVLELEKHGVF